MSPDQFAAKVGDRVVINIAGSTLDGEMATVIATNVELPDELFPTAVRLDNGLVVCCRHTELASPDSLSNVEIQVP